ncbi:MAG: Rpn family recombination-promoting nuclease/putative transposase [Nitrospirae bacterium]|nr:Rpn family recombination-promoting nuclease/putative transposase [Nitrospirota bacterium]
MSGRYDKILKESLRGVLHVLVSEVLGIKAKSIRPLKTKLQVTDEREADFLLDITLDDGSSYILHIEFQATNDNHMPYRMLRYRIYISQTYGKPVKQVLFYVGKEPLRMKNYIKDENLAFEYDIIDFRSIDCEKFMSSNTPAEVILGILCNFAPEDDTILIKKLLNRIMETVKEEVGRLKYIRQLEVLAQLRDLQENVCKEVRKMALVYDIERDVRYKQGMEKGMEKGIEKGIEKGLFEGKREGLLEGIELGLELRFGLAGLELMNIVRAINTVDKLEDFKNLIKKTGSMNELKDFLGKSV